MYSIVAFHFSSKPYWDILKRGFINSVQENTSAKLEFYDVDPPKQDSRRWKLNANNYKLKLWRDAVYDAKNPIVLMDTDIIVLDDIECGFGDEITLTTRPKKWVNAGVVFVRPVKEAEDFFDAWVDQDEKLYQGNVAAGNPTNLMRAWRKTKVKGQNQTALKMIYDDFSDNISWVEGQIYNSCQPDMWDNWKESKVLHIKDSLQNIVLSELNGKSKNARQELLDKILPYYKKSTKN